MNEASRPSEIDLAGPPARVSIVAPPFTGFALDFRRCPSIAVFAPEQLNRSPALP